MHGILVMAEHPMNVEPVYAYRVEGVYDVQLVAINDHGGGLLCTDTLTRKVTAKQGGVTKVPNAFTPNPSGPSAVMVEVEEPVVMVPLTMYSCQL
jgi:PKD repeat protein